MDDVLITQEPHSDGELISEDPTPRTSVKVSKNIALSMMRILVTAGIALVLPAYLTHHLAVDVYGAWVLILNLGSFVSFLDLGVQISVAKFVAEHDAKNDMLGASRNASAGLALLTSTGLLGVVLTLLTGWQVPRLFHNMPSNLYHDVRVSVVMVGCSLCFNLICSAYASVFIGLQRYSIPMGAAIINRLAYTISILGVVAFHGGLVMMAAVASVINVVTGTLQVIAWKRLASHIRVSLSLVDKTNLRQMVNYCFLLAIWTIGQVCVSGLDVTIVGHYAYAETAYYSVAALPSSFMIMVLGSVLGPMLPASSALGASRNAREMGEILSRATRYSTGILMVTAIPFILFGFQILHVWVGPVYAAHAVVYLRILILANIIRYLCAPYSTMVVGTGRLAAGTAAPVCEAIVNLGSSIYLASRYGAIGVAAGTILGSLVSVGMHFAVSMPRTQDKLEISRGQFFAKNILLPQILLLPAFAVWILRSALMSHAVFPFTIAGWFLASVFLLWFAVLKPAERTHLLKFARKRLSALSPAQANS